MPELPEELELLDEEELEEELEDELELDDEELELLEDEELELDDEVMPDEAPPHAVRPRAIAATAKARSEAASMKKTRCDMQPPDGWVRADLGSDLVTKSHYFGLANLVCSAYREMLDKNAKQVGFWNASSPFLFGF